MTEKKKKESDDFPFHKRSAGALATVEGGWLRCAMKEMKRKHDKYYIQGTTWKDKKQVGFLHSYKVGLNDCSIMERHMKGHGKPIQINSLPVQKVYAENFHAVNINDHDSAEYTTTIKTNHWYLWSFIRMLDCIVLDAYILASKNKYAEETNSHPEWK